MEPLQPLYSVQVVLRRYEPNMTPERLQNRQRKPLSSLYVKRRRHNHLLRQQRSRNDVLTVKNRL